MKLEVKYKRNVNEKYWTIEETSMQGLSNFLYDLYSKTDVNELTIKIRRLDAEDKESEK